MLGVYFGKRINLRSELLGGIILIAIGIKILMEHLQLI
jgi:putative Mn2+ efflux pump MntP